MHFQRVKWVCSSLITEKDAGKIQKYKMEIERHVVYLSYSWSLLKRSKNIKKNFIHIFSSLGMKFKLEFKLVLKDSSVGVWLKVIQLIILESKTLFQLHL